MMAANGLGVTLVPEMAIAAGVLGGLDLHAATLEADNSARRIALVWRRNAGRKETLRRVAAALRETMGPQRDEFDYRSSREKRRRSPPRFDSRRHSHDSFAPSTARRLSMTLRYFDMEALKAAPLSDGAVSLPRRAGLRSSRGVRRHQPRLSEDRRARQLPRRPADLRTELPRVPRRTGVRRIPQSLRGQVRPRSRGPAAHDHGPRPLQPQGRPHPHRHEEQDHHDPDLHESGMGACRRPAAGS